ncbi:MAG: stage II sporulation protein M [Firmicutes bacterium]|nr:stage II sporulation protein M [Bacillota bacterium]
MSITLNDGIKNHFMKNVVLYIIVILSFTVGICTGAFTVNALDYTQYEELSVYVQEFLNVVNMQDIDHLELFKVSMFNNIKTVVLLWILGITVIGIPFILIIIGIKGFVIGFTVGVMMKVLSTRGIFFSLVGILPQNLIMIPCYIVLGIVCINFSLSLVRSQVKKRYRKENIKSQFIAYSTCVFLAFFFLTIGSVIEAYVTPVFVKLILLTFIV